MSRIEKRLNFVGVKLTDTERAELDALKAAFDVSDSAVVRAALQLLARVTIAEGGAPQGEGVLG